MANIASLRKNPIVELVDDERDIGNGIIVTLRKGHTFDALADNRVAGADTLAEATVLLKSATPFAGPYDP